MKILMAIVTFHPVVGGTEQQTQALAAALVSKAHEVHVVTWRPPGSAAHDVLDGVHVFRAIRGIGRHLVFIGSYLLSLGWFVWRRRRRYDVIQAHFAYLDAVVVALLRPWLGRTTTVVRFGGGGLLGDLAKLRQLKIHWLVLPLIKRLDRFIVVSRQMRHELIDAGFDDARIVVIPNGVDAQRFLPADVPEAPPTVLSVARLSPEKGLEVLLEAWRLVTASRPGVRLVLVGDGPQRQALIRQAQVLGLDGSVLFAGEVADVRPYLNKSRVFVLPSLSEGLPNALLQAMAAGLPCVATRVGGVPEVIRDGDNGRLVAPGDPQQLAEAVSDLLRRPDEAGRYGAAARRTIESRFSVERMVEEYLSVYETGAGARRTGRGCAALLAE